MYEQLNKIHNSLVNGQRKQMTRQIDEYGLYDFWSDYSRFLKDCYKPAEVLYWFEDAVTSYHKIKNR